MPFALSRAKKFLLQCQASWVLDICKMSVKINDIYAVTASACCCVLVGYTSSVLFSVWKNDVLQLVFTVKRCTQTRGQEWPNITHLKLTKLLWENIDSITFFEQASSCARELLRLHATLVEGYLKLFWWRITWSNFR